MLGMVFNAGISVLKGGSVTVYVAHGIAVQGGSGQGTVSRKNIYSEED